MYCYKCGDRNSNRRAICRTCHFPLLPFSEVEIEMVEPAFSSVPAKPVQVEQVEVKAGEEHHEDGKKKKKAGQAIKAAYNRFTAARKALKDEVSTLESLTSAGDIERSPRAVAELEDKLPRISRGALLLNTIDDARLQAINDSIASYGEKLPELLSRRDELKADKENPDQEALREVEHLIRVNRKNTSILKGQLRKLTSVKGKVDALPVDDPSYFTELGKLALKAYDYDDDDRALIAKTKTQLAADKLVAQYQADVAVARAYKPTEDEAISYRRECLDAIDQAHIDQTNTINEFYKPKLEAAKGRDRKEVEENLHSAIADENESYSVSKYALGDDKQALHALHDTRVIVAQANVAMPERDDSEGSHALVQYLHKRTEKTRNRRESAACFLVVGLILLIIGFIFYFLSYKVSSDASMVDKILVPTSFEFIVFCFGVGIGSVMVVYGLTGVITSAVSIYRNKRAVNYLSHYQNLKV